MASAIQVGTMFTDATKNRYGTVGLAADAESFQVVQLTGISCGTNCVDVYALRNANPSYCRDSTLGGQGFPDGTISSHLTGWSAVQQPFGNCAIGTGFIIDPATLTSYYINTQSLRGHASILSQSAGTTTMVAVGNPPAAVSVYAVVKNRPWNLLGNPWDYFVGSTPVFSGFQQNATLQQSYIKCDHWALAGVPNKYCYDFHHLDPSGGVAPEEPGQTQGTALSLTLVGGTAHVYTAVITGTVDIKHFPLLIHAGDKQLIDISSAATGNQITDSTTWKYCIAYNAGECRTGSSAVSGSGLVYLSLPQVDNQTGSCELSQISRHVPCVFAGPTTATSFTQSDLGSTDPDGTKIVTFGHGMMLTPAQYVYSAILPVGNQLLFTQFLGNGYHTGLVVMDAPTATAQPTSGYVPIQVSYSSSSWYVQFGYEEYGNPVSGQFYCTPRQENCKVAGSTLSASTPFYFASETMTAAGSGAKVIVPKQRGMLLFYQIVDNGVAGALQVVP
jgi:hypothetical protein